MLRRVIYTSQATYGINKNSLAEIIRKASNHNIRDQITGALLFVDDHFLQVLEGDADGLSLCLKRIAKDDRHTNIKVREDLEIQAKVFPSYWMAMKDKSIIDPLIWDAFKYEPGFPEEKFSGHDLRRFMVAAFG
jgi:hypothetical protein